MNMTLYIYIYDCDKQILVLIKASSSAPEWMQLSASLNCGSFIVGCGIDPIPHNEVSTFPRGSGQTVWPFSSESEQLVQLSQGHIKKMCAAAK